MPEEKLIGDKTEMNEAPMSLGMSWHPSSTPTHTHAAPTSTVSTGDVSEALPRKKSTLADARVLALPDLADISWMRIQIFDNRASNARGMSQFKIKLDYCIGAVNTYRPTGTVFINLVPGSKIKSYCEKHFPSKEEAAVFYEPLLETRKINPEVRTGFVQVKNPKLAMGTVTFTDQFAVLQLFKERDEDGYEIEVAQLILGIGNADWLTYEIQPKDRCTKGASKYLAYYDPTDHNTARKQKEDNDEK
jgi:hypothetical protein